MGATVAGAGRYQHTLSMGSYGIGPSRLVAALIEAGHDDGGIIWPDEIAPFDIAVLNLKVGDAATDGACEQLYKTLLGKGYDALYDDTDTRPAASSPPPI
jgi:prolyl-tRNA synthetase